MGGSGGGQSNGETGLENISVPITGGAADGQFTSSSDGILTQNFNPIFSLGSGSPVDYGGSPSSSSSPATAPMFVSPYPAGPGYSTLNTALPTSALGLSSSSLNSSGLFVLLLIGGAVLLFAGGGRR